MKSKASWNVHGPENIANVCFNRIEFVSLFVTAEFQFLNQEFSEKTFATGNALVVTKRKLGDVSQHRKCYCNSAHLRHTYQLAALLAA